MAKGKDTYELDLTDIDSVIDEYGKLTHHASAGNDVLGLNDRIVVDDDWFMSICWERKDDRRKCDYCNLRFRCFTSRENVPENPGEMLP